MSPILRFVSPSTLSSRRWGLRSIRKVSGTVAQRVKKPVKWKRTKLTIGGLLASAGVFYVGCDFVAPKVPSKVKLEDGSEVVFADYPCNPYWMYLRWAGVDRHLSRAAGWLGGMKIPERMRWYIYTGFGTLYGVIWKDYRPDIEVYATFNDFFTRPLTAARPIFPSSLVSPVDGAVLAQGRVENNLMEQIKGVTYKAGNFLGFLPELQSEQTSLYYVVLYLRPGGYHRFHAPADAIIEYCHHFPGGLLPVKENVVMGYPGLFSINERVVLSGKWKEDYFFAYAAVGATNVGSIEINEDPELVTNQAEQDKDSIFCGYRNQLDEPYPNRYPKNPRKRSYFHHYDDPIQMVNGKEVGKFLFGSTIVLVFEATDAQFKLEVGQKTLVGQPLVEVV